MKNKIVLSLILLCLLAQNVYAQYCAMPPNLGEMMYVPLTGTSELWMSLVEEDGDQYDIKVHCLDGMPYKGEEYFDTLSLPIKEVNYWDSLYIVQLTDNMSQGGARMPLLVDVLITQYSISFKATEKIKMYIVNIFTGDSVFVYNFPLATQNQRFCSK